MIRASKNSAKRNQSESAQLLFRAQAAQRLQGRGRLRGRWLAVGPGYDTGFPNLRDSQLSRAIDRARHRDRISNRARHRLGV